MTVESLAPLVGLIARERTSAYPGLYDDARQEGLVRAWEVLGKRPDAPAPYVTAAVKRGVHDVLRGRPAFGAPRHRGRQDAHEGAVALTRQTDEGEEYAMEPEDTTTAAAYEAVDVRDAVQAAVRALPYEDRRLVFGRYWEDRSFADLALELGRPEGTLSRRWTDVVRPRLREALAPLAA